MLLLTDKSSIFGGAPNFRNKATRKQLSLFEQTTLQESKSRKLAANKAKRNQNLSIYFLAANDLSNSSRKQINASFELQTANAPKIDVRFSVARSANAFCLLGFASGSCAQVSCVLRCFFLLALGFEFALLVSLACYAMVSQARRVRFERQSKSGAKQKSRVQKIKIEISTLAQLVARKSVSQLALRWSATSKRAASC